GRAWLTGFERSTMGESFARAGLPIVADRRPDQHFFERSDNIAFAREGVPAHTLSSYNMHSDYHTPRDDMSHVHSPHLTAVLRASARRRRGRTVGSTRWQYAFRARRRPQARWRQLLPARHEQGRVRARGAGWWLARRQPEIMVHDGAPRRVGRAHRDPVLAL